MPMVTLKAFCYAAWPLVLHWKNKKIKTNVYLNIQNYEEKISLAPQSVANMQWMNNDGKKLPCRHCSL